MPVKVRAASVRALQGKPVFVVTGPSGAGKGTLIEALLARVPELAPAVSATTRARRAGEVDGQHYLFLSDAEFARRVHAGEFLEHVSYVSGHRYGTLRSELERIAASGRTPLLELEIEGALTVRDELPGSVTIFIDAPSFAELDRRLRERATESAGEIGERLALARRQREQAHEFQYVVVNDDVERAVTQLVEIVAGELAAAATISRR
jgi:guanylate kinase